MRRLRGVPCIEYSRDNLPASEWSEVDSECIEAMALTNRRRGKMTKRFFPLHNILSTILLLCCASFSNADNALTTADVMAAVKDADWRQPEASNLMLMRLPSGEVVLELAPGFAPNTVANIRKLVGEKYFDGLAVLRSHDNYVAQWGDPSRKKNNCERWARRPVPLPRSLTVRRRAFSWPKSRAATPTPTWSDLLTAFRPPAMANAPGSYIATEHWGLREAWTRAAATDQVVCGDRTFAATP